MYLGWQRKSIQKYFTDLSVQNFISSYGSEYFGPIFTYFAAKFLISEVGKKEADKKNALGIAFFTPAAYETLQCSKILGGTFSALFIDIIISNKK